jgi:hypothetical protein
VVDARAGIEHTVIANTTIAGPINRRIVTSSSGSSVEEGNLPSDPTGDRRRADEQRRFS